MMPGTKSKSQCPPDTGEEDVSRWVRAVHRLPVVRVEKVIAARDALRRHCYDNEQILAQTVERLSNDVGVLCRREWSLDPA